MIAEIFQYSFLLRSLLVGVVVATIAPMIGSYLVVRRYSLFADALAHISLTGIAIAIILGQSPLLISVVFTVLMALLIEYLRLGKRMAGDAVIAIFLSGSLALAVLLISIHTSASNVNLMGFLFGSISAVTSFDLKTMIVLALVVAAIAIMLRKELFITAFDPEYAQVSGIPVRFINVVYIILAAVTVSLSIRIVGVLLIGALMIVPVLSAARHTASFKQLTLHSSAIAIMCVILGVGLSYLYAVPAGATIVLLLIIMFILSLLTAR
ncbi:MAG: metal ABC transporter permease [Patescibacteria group bacterium]